jgi:arsenate reductase
LNPLAVEVMGEIGIDIAGQRSKVLDEFVDQPIDVVVTVCDRARESCPVFPRAGRLLHWSFEDPAAAAGTEDERRDRFRAIRDEIRARIERFLHEA